MAASRYRCTDVEPGGPSIPFRAWPSTHAVQPSIEHHHRDIQRGSARAAVFGVSDGLVSNVSLILGVAGANPQPGVVRLAGLAGLIAGAVSMAAGEYVSMRAQTELFERELDIERRELRAQPPRRDGRAHPDLRGAGRAADRARALAEDMMRDPDVALETHAREELGIDPGSLGSPWWAALSSFLAFTVGALIPLLPWLFGSGDAAVIGVGGARCDRRARRRRRAGPVHRALAGALGPAPARSSPPSRRRLPSWSVG